MIHAWCLSVRASARTSPYEKELLLFPKPRGALLWAEQDGLCLSSAVGHLTYDVSVSVFSASCGQPELPEAHLADQAEAHCRERQKCGDRDSVGWGVGWAPQVADTCAVLLRCSMRGICPLSHPCDSSGLLTEALNRTPLPLGTDGRWRFKLRMAYM